MADCKIISATAKAQVTDVNDGAKTATAAIKEITTNIKDISVTSAVPNQCLESRLKGFGEEWIPDARKFTYLPEVFELVDAIVFAAGRALSDNVSKTETLRKSLSKLAADNLDASDSVLFTSNAFRTFAELIDATDDFLGAANIDDDQKAAFIKVLNETCFTAEDLKLDFTFGRLFLDALSKTERFELAFNKGITDTSTTAEALVKALELVLDGSGYFLEDYTQPDYDAGGLSVTDSLAMSSGKIFEESPQIVSDVVFKGIGRAIEDSVDATDDFLGVSNVDDDQTAAFLKVLSDTQSISETYTRLISPAKIETVNTDENITAFMQSYFASNYVPNGYVGSAYTL